MLSVGTEVLCVVTNIDATPGYYLLQVGSNFMEVVARLD